MNNNYLFNKKGGDKLLTLYWFFIIVTIGAGVFIIVYIFYSAPYDVRSLEAEILSNKIVDCISRGGKLNSAFNEAIVSDKGIDVFKECSLNFEVEKDFDLGYRDQYFFKIEIFEFGLEEDSKIVISGGNINWEMDCFIRDKKGREYKNLVHCSEKRVYAINDSSHQFLIKVLSGVGKFEKNLNL